MIISRSILAI